MEAETQRVANLQKIFPNEQLKIKSIWYLISNHSKKNRFGRFAIYNYY